MMSDIFVTGCDDKTAWQLPWFLHHFRANNEGQHLVLADFGLSDTSVYSKFDGVIMIDDHDGAGWFKKPSAIETASKLEGVERTCWLDTDCEVKGDISGIFQYAQREMLGMVEDRPWTFRRPNLGEWYNSGVVVVNRTPYILTQWKKRCIEEPVQGDQEVLHLMMDGNRLKKIQYINPVPHKYNTLRLDHLDGIAVNKPLVEHHTGSKGKEVIRRQINELFN